MMKLNLHLGTEIRQKKYILFLVFALLFSGFANAQEDSARDYLIAKIDSQIKHDLSIHRGKMSSCDISVEIEPMRPVIKIDSPYKDIFSLIVKNHGKDTCNFPALYGGIEDNESLMTLRLLKKRRGKYILVSDRQKWYEETSISATCVKINPGKERWDGERLYSYFDIPTKGKYKIDGFYKTNCNKVFELHKIDGVYFEVK